MGPRRRIATRKRRAGVTRRRPAGRAGAARRKWWPLGRAGSRVSASGRTAPGLEGAGGPIDPLAGPRFALAGRVVTMDGRDTVLADGVVYVDGGAIAGVRDRIAPRPPGFEQTPVIESRGTLFPGLIELHNHLSYDALPPWAPIPRRFDHTGQWQSHPDYGRLVTGPMTVIGKTPSLLPALVRYVEAKCLLAGVTTSQGIRLASNAGVSTYYRGTVRNVEQTDDPSLPEAAARIGDVTAKDAARFLDALEAARRVPRCQLLHLAEGTTRPGDATQSARRHFLALEVAPGRWAINPALAGIHSSGLLPEDLAVLAGLGGAIVWSPLSNLLLYGATTDVAAARRLGVRMGLGSDWSPTGSKNLLGELKVAWLYSQYFLDGELGPRDLVAMVTRGAAEILRWEAALGSLEPGKRADLVVVDGLAGDPHEALLRATERSIRLVVINGRARYGAVALMRKLTQPGGPPLETLRVAGQARALDLHQATAHPLVEPVPLGSARETLRDALLRIRDLAAVVDRGPDPIEALERAGEVVWSLALDEIEPTGLEMRPRLPWAGDGDFTGPSRGAGLEAAVPLAQRVAPVALDPLTVADDADYIDEITAQPNVPAEIRRGLRGLH